MHELVLNINIALSEDVDGKVQEMLINIADAIHRYQNDGPGIMPEGSEGYIKNIYIEETDGEIYHTKIIRY